MSPAPKSKSKSAVKPLRGVSDIRRFFYENETPIYFISATNFNLLGADEWVKGFKFITYIDCFDGAHPNLFAPTEIPHDEFTSIEDINNYLLEHKEVVDYIRSRGDGGKALFLMFDERTEKLAAQLNLEMMFPSAEMRTFMDNKVNTNRIAEKAGVPPVPYVLANISSYEQLNEVSKHLGDDLVVQTPFGDSGHTTFFISNKKEWEKYAAEIIKESEVKVMKRINCRGAAMEACVTRHGTLVAPLMTELVGFKELTPYKGGWCGNEIYRDAFTESIRRKTRKYAQLFGDQLWKEGYRGYFELDFLIDTDTNEVYLGELNPRVTGASSITNHALFALSDAPLFLFHMMEYMDHPYELSITGLNRRWARDENIDSWSQLVIKHVDDDLLVVTEAPDTGIWRMEENGKAAFNRMDSHRRAVETEQEAFFMRIVKPGDYLYEGADMGILVVRGRLMTDDFQLTNRARRWIDAIREMYKAKLPGNDLYAQQITETPGFKFL